MRTTTNGFLEMVSKDFIQVHRSYIINIDKLTRVYGNQAFISNQPIPIGKTYKEKFLKRLNS